VGFLGGVITYFHSRQPSEAQDHHHNTTQPNNTEMSVRTTATIASFGGKLLKLAHDATTTNCEMAFNLYLPPQATLNPLHKVPVLIYLSGLTCTGDNCAEKGFFQHKASQRGVAVLYPDTSPRECWLSLVREFRKGGLRGWSEWVLVEWWEWSGVEWSGVDEIGEGEGGVALADWCLCVTGEQEV